MNIYSSIIKITTSIFVFLLIVLFSCNTNTKVDSDHVHIPNSFEDMSAYYNNQSDTTLFRLVPPSESKIDFMNTLLETMENNFWNFKFVYSGSGVGTGDFNKDGLLDLFFVSNTNSNALYINKGDLQFEDISISAGIQDSSGISHGVSIADFNEDGWLDIYVTKAGGPSRTEAERSNKLFINNHDLTFTDKAKEFGLDNSTNGSQANLFDYDNDGDQDLYLTTHWLSDKQLGSVKALPHIEKGTNFSDFFYEKVDAQIYTDQSKNAGINNHGMGWSASIGDFNNDSWTDIYVANDFIMYNYLYWNQKNKTFKLGIFESLKKMTRFGMGSDCGDINNDGFLDIVVGGIYMDNHRDQKSMFDYSDTKAADARYASGYHYQKERSTLQLNNRDGTFSEIACFAGVNVTNWTWAMFLEDFDNDGWKDLFAANGFYNPWYLDNRLALYSKLRRMVKTGKKDDFFQLRESMFRNHHKDPNQIYKNNKDLTFSSKTTEWGLDIPTVSYGAIVADLDNDGDMDIIAANTNQAPTFYENRSRQLNNNNYIKISFNGPQKNSHGIGSKVHLYDEANNLMQYKHQQPIRGFLSTSDNRLNFGIGTETTIPKITITWPDGKQQSFNQVPANTNLIADYSEAVTIDKVTEPQTTALPFQPSNDILSHQQKENIYDDFDRQFTLHHGQSKHGPSVAIADVNGDELEDVLFGGAQNQATTLYLQDIDGRFNVSQQNEIQQDAKFEDMGSLFFDADGDGDMDLYQCSGGGEYHADASRYQDRLYFNDGKGNFTKTSNALPKLQSSGSCVVAADYDKDGDMDLFVGGRVSPSFYPNTPRSYLLQNNKGIFTDVTPTTLQLPGMVTSALWTDFNNDEAIDLILVGDWMPIRFFKNENNELTEVRSGLENTEGWWNSITGADFDEDGDIDYVIGNAGLNTHHESPIVLHYGDYNDDGQLNLMPTYQQAGNYYPAFSFGAFQRSFPEWKDQVGGFAPYAKRNFSEIQAKFFPGKGEKLEANTFANVILENKGKGQFTLRALPKQAQLAPINGIITDDFDGDGHTDIICHGNFYPAHYVFERQDAGVGLFLKGKGNGQFTVFRGAESGFKSDMDARSLVLVDRDELGFAIIATNNSEKTLVFEVNKKAQKFRFSSDDKYALLKLANGKVQKIENYVGSGYLSQRSTTHLIGSNVIKVEIVGADNQRRVLSSLVSK